MELLFLPLLRVGNAVELTPGSLTYYVHAREREREKEREDRRRKKRGGRGPTRAERGEETEKKHVHAAPACPYSGSPMSCGPQTRRTEKNPGRPSEEKEEKKDREEEKERKKAEPAKLAGQSSFWTRQAQKLEPDSKCQAQAYRQGQAG